MEQENEFYENEEKEESNNNSNVPATMPGTMVQPTQAPNSNQQPITNDWEFELKRQENVLKHERHLRIVEDSDSRIMTNNHLRVQALNTVSRIFSPDSPHIMGKIVFKERR